MRSLPLQAHVSPVCRPLFSVHMTVAQPQPLFLSLGRQTHKDLSGLWVSLRANVECSPDSSHQKHSKQGGRAFLHNQRQHQTDREGPRENDDLAKRYQRLGSLATSRERNFSRLCPGF